jgi:membrane-bound inhibitor of C-type lysozyme
MTRLLTAFSFFALLLSACAQTTSIEVPADSFTPVTSVYDCIARERPFSIVTQTAPSALHVFIPEPFVPRTVLLQRVESASGEKYEGESVTAWTKGDDAVFIVDTVQVRECELNRQESIWEAAKLDGVDFRAIGNEPGWVLEISERSKLRFRYDYGQSEIEAIADDIVPDPDSRETVFSATTSSGELRIVLSGKVCTDTMSDEVFRTSVLVEYMDASYSGCGRALH